MTYDFESLTPARGACPHVWDYIKSRGIADPEAISYAVAEMKFPLAPEISSALHRCVDTGYLGYGSPSDHSETVCTFMNRRHGWDPRPEWLIQTYGVVLAISVAIRAFTEEGDGIIIQTPVYNPFFEKVLENRRVVLDDPLIRRGDRYEMDFEDLARKAAEPGTKMMILCSPHNPVGRVWTREELARVSEICARNGVIVVSDEIHHDLVYGREHTVFAAVSEEAEQNCVVCTAPSKSFNIPGLITSNIFIPNGDLRERFRREANLCMGHFLNPMGIAASTAAYESCGPWLDELCAYLEENAACFRSLVAERLPKAWTPKMEGTYLAWLDLGYLGLSDRELEELVIRKAQLLVNMGVTYGNSGSGFVRVNIGCPRRYIKAFVGRLAEAIEGL